MNSKIAVIMPVYNAGKFLKGSIESILFLNNECVTDYFNNKQLLLK